MQGKALPPEQIAWTQFYQIFEVNLRGAHAYGPMKAAIIGLTQSLAGEWGRSGVRVNCVSPGPVLTPAMQTSFDQGLRDRDTMAGATASGQICLPQEVAQAVAFLLSDQASAITGVNLAVDHGWLVATSWQTFGGLRASKQILEPD